MGATLTVNVTRTSIEEARKELGIIGFDIGLEMSGNGAAFESMLENMYHGGRIALLGILPNSTGIRWDQVIFKGLVIKGIYGREIFETWYKMQTMLQSGLDVRPVLTHRFPFEQFEKGFEVMQSGNCGKVILSIAEDSQQCLTRRRAGSLRRRWRRSVPRGPGRKSGLIQTPRGSTSG